MTIQYDPRVIEANAAALYEQANKLIARFATYGAVVGFFVGVFPGSFLAGAIQLLPWAGALIVGIALGIVGWSIGRGIGERRAFMLYLEAQVALCQVQIEKNTRREKQ